jgi:hypothetical protein
MLDGPNHRLNANLHISFSGRKIPYLRVAVRPARAPMAVISRHEVTGRCDRTGRRVAALGGVNQRVQLYPSHHEFFIAVPDDKPQELLDCRTTLVGGT